MDMEQDLDAVKTQYNLERLKKIDEQNRLRSNRYLQKHYSQNKKQISAIISEEAYQEICRRKELAKAEGENLSNGEIIEEALFHVCRVSETVSLTNSEKSTVQIEPDLFNQSDSDIKDTEHNNTFDVNTSNEKIEPISDDLSYYHFNQPPLSDKRAYSVWLKGYIMELHKQGLTNHKVMAELEKQGIKTVTGLDKWKAGTIGNVIIREKRKLNSGLNGVDVDAGE